MAEDSAKLIVSFHDLHPGSQSACIRFLELAREAGISRMSLLVVPQFHRNRPFTEEIAFCHWLRQLADAGHDLCLHGYYHESDQVKGGLLKQITGKVYTAGEGEFYQIDTPTATDRLKRGLAIMEQAKLPVTGFTAPAWLVSDAATQALRENGFTYSTRWGEVDLLQSQSSLNIPTLVYSCRNTWRRVVSKRWINFFHRKHRNTPTIRLSIHPADLEYPDIVEHLQKHLKLAMQTRQAATYSDLVPADERKSLTSTPL